MASPSLSSWEHPLNSVVTNTGRRDLSRLTDKKREELQNLARDEIGRKLRNLCRNFHLRAGVYGVDTKEAVFRPAAAEGVPAAWQTSHQAEEVPAAWQTSHQWPQPRPKESEVFILAQCNKGAMNELAKLECLDDYNRTLVFNAAFADFFQRLAVYLFNFGLCQVMYSIDNEKWIFFIQISKS